MKLQRIIQLAQGVLLLEYSEADGMCNIDTGLLYGQEICH